MGTPDFAVPTLERLISSQHDIVAVYTRPDKPAGRGQSPVAPPVKNTAVEHGLTVIQPLSLKNPEERDRLVRLKPDVMVTAAYGQLLPRSILDIAPHGCLNIHPSLLPRHRGPSPVASTILAGDEITGVSLMLMDEGMDTGPVIAKKLVPICAGDTTRSLTAKLAQIGAELLVQTLPLWLHKEVTLETQEEGKATYSRLIRKVEGKIDWRRPAEELGRKVRAFQPWPGCYTTWRGKMLKIIAAVPLSGTGAPGKVIIIENRPGISLGVQTGEGVLGLQQLQLEGKRIMSVEEFVHGQKDFNGALLPC